MRTTPPLPPHGRPTLTSGPLCVVCQLPAAGRLHTAVNLLRHPAFRPPVLLTDGSRLEPPTAPQLHTQIPVCDEPDCWRLYTATWATPGYETFVTGLDDSHCGPPIPGVGGRPSLHATHIPRPPRTAVQWLTDYLDAHPGAVVAREVLTAAQQAGYGRSTMQHASRDLGVVKSRTPGGPWLWSPPNDHADADTSHAA